MTQTEQDRIAAEAMADIKAAGQRQEKWKA